MDASPSRVPHTEDETRDARIATRRLRPASGDDDRRAAARDPLALLHHLKNLHTCILGNARILQREVGEEGFLRQRADALIGAARIAVDLIHDLCAGAEAAHDANRRFELSALVRDAEPLLRAVLPERVELHLDLATSPRLVAACPESIRRILLELVVNAAEAIGDAGGRVEVRTGHSALAAAELAIGEIGSGPHAWLEVRDDGAGFDARARARLFERGFSTKGSGRGRGLGLVRETVERHRAGLLVGNLPAGGSAFRILLPCAG